MSNLKSERIKCTRVTLESEISDESSPKDSSKSNIIMKAKSIVLHELDADIDFISEARDD